MGCHGHDSVPAAGQGLTFFLLFIKPNHLYTTTLDFERKKKRYTAT